MHIPVRFIQNFLAPTLFEAVIERIDDDLTARLLLCYTWCCYVLAERPEMVETVSVWLAACIEVLEEAAPTSLSEHDY